MAAHWEPTLRVAFGSDWRAEYGSEVAAMLQLTAAAAQMPPPAAMAAPAADGALPQPALSLERPFGASADTSPASYDHSRTDDEPCSLASCSETSTLESSGLPAERRLAQAEMATVGEATAMTMAHPSAPADLPRLPAGSWGSGGPAPQPQPGVISFAAQDEQALASSPLSSPLDAVFERCKTYLASVTQAAAAASGQREAMGPPLPAGPASLLGQSAPVPLGLAAGLMPLFTSASTPTCASGHTQHAGGAGTSSNGTLELTSALPIATVAPAAAPPPLWQPTPATTTSAAAPQLPAVPQSLLATNVLDGCDCWGRSPLMVAAAAGRLAVVRQLLAAGCSASKWLPVDYRCDSNTAVRPVSCHQQHPSLDPPHCCIRFCRRVQHAQLRRSSCCLILGPCEVVDKSREQQCNIAGRYKMALRTAVQLVQLHGRLPPAPRTSRSRQTRSATSPASCMPRPCIWPPTSATSW